MATSRKADTKWQDHEDEEEALSLSDLPLGDEENREADDHDPRTKTGQEEFDFGSLCGSVLTEQEMCAADEVFFKGQILPLRLSDRRSVSMDHSSLAGLTSISSRSSSINSSSTTTTSTSISTYKPKLRNQFHTHPSPNPQIRTSSGARTGNRSRRWSVWDFLRLGLVQTPEIELEDLKIRTKSNKDENKGIKRDGLSRSSGFLRGCKCSVETAPLQPIMLRSNSTMNAKQIEQEVKTKKTIKLAMSRHRTFEWLEELSHVDHDILL